MTPSAFLMLGSSPHTWRILTQYPIEIGDLRIISTYVENTKFRISGIFRHKDHLHIRGEYQSCSSTSIYQLGSSPHTWRIHIDMDKTSGRVRIISTYVENTFFFSVMAITSWDHLHIRGEYTIKFQVFRLQIGSSPHTWRILKFRSSK